MKGPGHRHRFDVRRNWVCPACNRRVKTSGRVVHLLCDCLMKSTPPRQTWMTLLEEKPRAQPSAAPGIPQQEEQPSTLPEQVPAAKESSTLSVQIVSPEMPAMLEADKPPPV